jgi:type IV secretion system protein TrbI
LSISRQAQAPVLTTAVYRLDDWTYIPCQLETVLHSEIPGYFTVKTTRPVYDTRTGRHQLIPQGQRMGAKAETADLLFGNERIPTFGVSFTRADGRHVDLGKAPIMDAQGTNGLRGEIDNHVWRLVWTSVFIGGLRGGQEVLQRELGQAGAGPIASGITQEGANKAQQRLGRAQDTRPTIIAAAGELCNVLLPKGLELPEITLAQR